MGRKHRVKRSNIKEKLRKQGWYENEFGELQKRISKAEARQRLLQANELRLRAISEVIDRAIEVACREIQEEEDRRIFELIDSVAQGIYENQNPAISLRS